MRIEHPAGISNLSRVRTNMPTPFSVDLRWWGVWLHLSTNYVPARLAQIMSVSEHTVWCYIFLFGRIGDVQPRKRRNGPRMLMGDFEQIMLLRLILENPGMYFTGTTGSSTGHFRCLSVLTVCRTLKYMGCTRQEMH